MYEHKISQMVKMLTLLFMTGMGWKYLMIN